MGLQITPAEWKRRPDLDIHGEYPVLQLTTKGGVNVCQYFTHRSWTRDDKWIVFASNRTGGVELHAASIETGDVALLTRGANVFLHGWAITPDDRAVLYVGGTRLDEFHLVDLDGGEDRLIAAFPPHFTGFFPSIIDVAPDGDTFYMCTNTRPTLCPSNLLVGSIRRGSVSPFFPEAEETAYFFDHQMLCPANPSLLQVNKTPRDRLGRGDAPQRMWLLDVGTREMRPLYKQKRSSFRKFERVGHEAWLPDGKHLCFVVRRDKVMIVSIEGAFGSEFCWCAGKGPNFWHVSANPARPMLAADTMWRDTGIWLVELVEGSRGSLFNLCHSRSAWQDPSFSSLTRAFPYAIQGHPHPGWSPSGRFLHFTTYSPADKAVHVCVVDVESSPFAANRPLALPEGTSGEYLWPRPEM
ncbi:MAG: PD40 domain-containing protein [Candidatus Lokiarchaeota archaeon]|nr:PD40 domain-containing protein [Candidatus Lokiarchaeota archaeon]